MNGFTLTRVFNVNDNLIVARSLEDAIAVYRLFANSETEISKVELVTCCGNGTALIREKDVEADVVIDEMSEEICKLNKERDNILKRLETVEKNNSLLSKENKKLKNQNKKLQEDFDIAKELASNSWKNRVAMVDRSNGISRWIMPVFQYARHKDKASPDDRLFGVKLSHDGEIEDLRLCCLGNNGLVFDMSGMPMDATHIVAVKRDDLRVGTSKIFLAAEDDNGNVSQE